MKKLINLILFTIIMTFCINISAVAAIDNSKDSAVILPLRFICEAQGAIVTWDADTNIAYVKKGSNILSVAPDKSQIKFNDSSVSTNSVQVVNERIKVPLNLINQGLGTNLTVDDCIKILAVKYMELLKQGQISDCQMLFSNGLKQAATPLLISQLEAHLNSLGEIKLSEVIISENLVHRNAVMTYSSPLTGTFNYILRFNQVAEIDDIRPLAAQDIGYKIPEYDKADSYTVKDVVVGTGDWQLPAKLSLPNGKGPFPVLVLVHGSGPNDMDETLGPLKPFADISAGLASKGIAVLRYNKRTYEHSMKFTAISKLTVKEETVDDAVTAVASLKGISEIDTSRIYVLGHSQGGMLIPRILQADKDNSIKGAVIMSGLTRSLMDTMIDQYRYLSTLNMATKEQYEFYKAQMEMIKAPSFSAENPPSDFVMGTPYWWADLKSYSPTVDAKKITKPLLVLQGQRDYQVTVADDYTAWKDALEGKKNVSFKLYPKLNHMYTEGVGAMSTPLEYSQQSNIPAYVIEDIAEWIGLQ